ncbi:MAG TPA: hypothetical protein VN976_22110 [Verrucomicrobiae bacterium]|nr:hypothetical protein [Verrucomicrobiae bacterium]
MPESTELRKLREEFHGDGWQSDIDPTVRHLRDTLDALIEILIAKEDAE